MSFLQGPIFALTWVLAVVVLASVVRRLLGARFSATRLVVAAGISYATSAPILTAMLGPKRPDGSLADAKKPLLLVLALLVILLPSMVFLVVAEALAPSGSLPTPLEWIRGLRSRVARSRRY